MNAYLTENSAQILCEWNDKISWASNTIVVHPAISLVRETCCKMCCILTTGFVQKVTNNLFSV